MTAIDPVRTERIVIVHGEPGCQLRQVLEDSGLEILVDAENVKIWAPRPTPAAPSAAPVAEPLMVDIDSAAMRLGVSRSTVYRLIEAHRLDTVHVGRSVRIPLAALDDLVRNLRSANN